MKKMVTTILLAVALTITAVVPAFAFVYYYDDGIISANGSFSDYDDDYDDYYEPIVDTSADALAIAQMNEILALQAAQAQAAADAQAAVQAQALAAAQAAQAQAAADAQAAAQAQALAAAQAAQAQAAQTAVTTTALSSQYITMPDGVIFDAMYYAAANPDVVNAYGLDPQALYRHYQKYGKKEGRSPFNPIVLLQLAQ